MRNTEERSKQSVEKDQVGRIGLSTNYLSEPMIRLIFSHGTCAVTIQEN